MNCPKCGRADVSYIIDSRRRNTDGYVLRKRKCMCEQKFNTVEVSVLTEDSLNAIRRESYKNGGRKEFEEAIRMCYESIFRTEKNSA